jgi:hypothetical protein
METLRLKLSAPHFYPTPSLLADLGFPSLWLNQKACVEYYSHEAPVGISG